MPKKVDIYVGARLRLRRTDLRVSQARLAEAIDRTTQQLQKYESGINRVSASTLYEASRFLNVPVQYFFDGYEDPADSLLGE